MPAHPALARQLDLVGLATIADVVPLQDENRALAAAGLRQLARTRRPGLRALMQTARVDPATRRRHSGRLPARAADQRRRDGCTGPTSRSTCCSPRTPTRRGAWPDELEGLNRERQAVEDRMLRDARRARRGLARGAATPPRLRALGRGLARGRDRHRRVTPRGAVQPAGRADRRHEPTAGRDPAARSRRSTCTPRSAPAPTTSSASAATAPPPASSIRTEQLEAFAEAFAAHADAVLAEDDLRPRAGRRRDRARRLR